LATNTKVAYYLEYKLNLKLKVRGKSLVVSPVLVRVEPRALYARVAQLVEARDKSK
jgi:hypothetical protein